MDALQTSKLTMAQKLELWKASKQAKASTSIPVSAASNSQAQNNSIRRKTSATTLGSSGSKENLFLRPTSSEDNSSARKSLHRSGSGVSLFGNVSASSSPSPSPSPSHNAQNINSGAKRTSIGSLFSANDVQNFDPNVFHSSNSDVTMVQSFQDCENDNSLQKVSNPVSSLLKSPPFKNCKSPTTLNPRHSYSNEQRKRISVSRKSLDEFFTSKVEENNDNNIMVRSMENCSLVPDESSRLISSMDISPVHKQISPNYQQQYQEILLENESLKRTVNDMRSNESLQLDLIEKLQNNIKVLEKYKATAEMSIEEIDSYRFLSSIQEQRIAELENSVSKSRVDHHESVNNKIKKYKSELARVTKEKQDYEQKANEMIQQMTEQMTNLQNFAMSRIDTLEKELMEERKKCSDLQNSMNSMKLSSLLHSSLMTQNHGNHHTGNNTNTSTNNENSAKESTNPPSNDSTPRKSNRKSIGKSSSNSGKSKSSMDSESTPPKASKSINNQLLQCNDHNSLSNRQMSADEQLIHQRQLHDSLALLWSPKSTNSSSSSNKTKNKAKNRRCSSMFACRNSLLADDLDDSGSDHGSTKSSSRRASNVFDFRNSSESDVEAARNDVSDVSSYNDTLNGNSEDMVVELDNSSNGSMNNGNMLFARPENRRTNAKDNQNDFVLDDMMVIED